MAGYKVFLFDEDEAMKGVPKATFDKFLYEKESFDEFANKSVRYAFVTYDTVGKEPGKMKYADFGYMSFNADGNMEHDEHKRQLILAIEKIEARDLSDRIAASTARKSGVATRRDSHLCKWEPNEKVLSEIRYDLWS